MATKTDLCSCNKREFFPAKVKAVVGDYERIISFKTGYECEIPFTNGHSHGRHGMEMIFILKGKLGVIQFVVYTGWMPSYKRFDGEKSSPLPADIGKHSYKPSYDDETKRENCNWLDGADCYYDGSGLAADEVFKVFVKDGEEAMWTELEKFYKDWLVARPRTEVEEGA